MNIPTNLKYTKDHEWVLIDGDIATVGITDFAQKELGDIVYVEVETLDQSLSKDEVFGTVEAVKTVSDLLAHSSTGSIDTVITKTIENQSILSFAQERLWFIEQYEQGTNAYHMPSIFELDVATDIEGIKYALQGVITRHQVLRSTIEQIEGLSHGIQIVHDDVLFIEELELGSEDDYEIVIKSDINRPFDLSREYPIRAKFYIIGSESGTQRRLLVINMHHIASDGWSMDIFQRELLSYYQGYIDGDKNFELPALDIQYKDFAVWQRTYLTGEVLENQLGYWKSKLSGYQTLEFPTDYIRPSHIDYKGGHVGFVLNSDTSDKKISTSQIKIVILAINQLLISQIKIAIPAIN